VVNTRLRMGKLLCILFVILLLLIIPSVLLGEEADGNASFVLTIQDNFISLTAKDAPVAEIVKEIGRRLEIEIAGAIPATEKVSLAFENLTFDEALARLRVDYAYVTGKGNRIIKVTLIPKGEGDGGPITTSQSASVRTVGTASKPEGDVVTEERSQQPAPGKTRNGDEPRPEPFKFEFNP